MNGGSPARGPGFTYREGMPQPLQEFTVAGGQGVELRCYDTGGSRPAVVVLHGLAGSAREFFPTAAALAERRTVLVDLRGHGASTRHPDDVSREAYVADVVRVIEAVGPPVALVGQSMGGHTAMLVAAARHDLVSQLALLEADAGGGRGEDHVAVGEYFRSWPVPFPNRAAAAAFLGDSPLALAWSADLEGRDGGFRPRFDAGVMVAAISAMAVPRWAEWESVAVPTLVVYGQDGMFDEAAKAEFVRRGRNVTRVDLPGASHDAHLDCFGPWMAALKGFMRP
jgi:pimeloyl-ACP methyl ester carboxylesterase